MRILFIIRDMVIGGAGKQLALTANAFAQRGHQVFIYSYYGGENKHHIDSSVEYESQTPVPKTKFSEYLFSVYNIRKQIKKKKPDVVISWRCNAGCFAKLASIGLQAKTIFSERTDPYTEKSLALKISSFIASFSDGGVFQTEAVRNYYKRLHPKSVVIHNPFDNQVKTPLHIPIEQRQNEIVHIARMQLVQKRQDLMLEAFAEFLKKHNDYTLSFYGDGVDFEQVKQIAKKLGISNKVVFHGNVINAASKIGQAKAFVLTSDYEGIPNVLMEAFAMEVPVISTDCNPGGARVLIDNNENGFIVPTGNPIKIAEKMCELTENNHLAESFIEKGKEKLKMFSPEVIFDKWNEYLARVISLCQME